MTDKKKILIVVVNYNGFEYTCECVESLLKLSVENFYIYVVDNGSTDNSGKMIKDLYSQKIGFKSLPENLGVTGGNNAGIDYAIDNQYDYILFLNNDTTVETDFLDVLMRTSQESDNALVVPKIVCFYDRDRLDHWIGSDFNWWTGRPSDHTVYPYDQPMLNVKCDIRVASTCCLLVPSELINDIGKMDPNYFMYYDDADFTIRASRAGYRMIYEPQAIIYHKCNMTTRNKQPSYFEFYLVNRNFFYFYNKLCENISVKYLFMLKRIIILTLGYAKSYIMKKSIKRKITEQLIKDIVAKKMGPPPDFDAVQ